MVDGMHDLITCISTFKYSSKSELLSFEWSVEELRKDKSQSSEKPQLLGDEYRRMIGGLFKKYNEIYDSNISKSESISDMWGNYLTLALKE